MKNRKIFLAIVIFVSVFVLDRVYSRKLFSFDQITGDRLSEVKYVTYVDGKKEDANMVLRSFQSCQYVKYHGSLGNTARMHYKFYDSDDFLVFEIIDVGNQNIIGIASENHVTYYQQVD